MFPALRCTLLLSAMLLLLQTSGQGGVSSIPNAAYKIEMEIVVPGTPGAVFDAMTGDISGWWDHSFSAKPYRLFIEPKPGGGFYELFNKNGEGVRHATVTYAERGKKLRFEGPLGLSGRAITSVVTWQYEATGADSTRLSLSAHMAGEIDEKTAGMVESVWRHFLFERFAPYIQGRQKERGTHK